MVVTLLALDAGKAPDVRHIVVRIVEVGTGGIVVALEVVVVALEVVVVALEAVATRGPLEGLVDLLGRETPLALLVQ